jgi:hypothetical protein
MVKQSGRMGHTTSTGISQTINKQLQESGVTLQECADFDNHELNELIRTFWCHMSPDLHDVYKSRRVDGRKLRFDSLAE